MVRLARRALVGLGLFLLLAFVAETAVADTGLGGKLRYGDTIVVPAGETVDSDLYVFAGRVTVDGAVHGDLVAFGGTITVAGTVDGDIIAAGGTVDLAGPVGEAVRAAGGDITVSGPVTKDVLAASGRLTASGPIGGDLIFSAGQVTVTGAVTGSIDGRAGTYNRSGTVGGTESVVIQPINAPAVTPIASNPIGDGVRQFVAVVLFGALLLWLLPSLVRASEEVVRRQPLLAFVGGLGVLVGYIVAILALFVGMIVLAIVFGAITLGNLVVTDLLLGLLGILALTFGFVLTVSFVVDGVVGLAIARRLVPAMNRASRWQELGLLAAGAALVVIASSLPVVGWLVKLIVVLVGLGAIGMVIWTGWQGRQSGATGPAAAPTAPAPTTT